MENKRDLPHLREVPFLQRKISGSMSDEPENAALAGFAVHTEGKAVVDEDGLCDGKPQPCADLAGVRAGAVVFVKDIGKIFPGNARAVVLNLYPHGGVRLRFYAQRHTAVRPDMMDGVRQQIVHHTAHHVRVCRYGTGVGSIYREGVAALLTDILVAVGHFVAQLCQVELDGIELFGAGGIFGKLHHAVHKGRRGGRSRPR